MTWIRFKGMFYPSMVKKSNENSQNFNFLNLRGNKFEVPIKTSDQKPDPDFFLNGSGSISTWYGSETLLTDKTNLEIGTYTLYTLEKGNTNEGQKHLRLLLYLYILCKYTGCIVWLPRNSGIQILIPSSSSSLKYRFLFQFVELELALLILCNHCLLPPG